MKIMSIDDSVLEFMGGIEQNSLSHLLRYNENDDDSLEIIQNSHYYDNDFLTSHLKSNADKFCILSTNIQAVKSKFNELEAFIHDLSENGFQFDVICLQECNIQENEDLTLNKLSEYNLVPQGKSPCCTKGGLIVYIHERYNYNVKLKYNMSNVWEGQFIEITAKSLKRNIVLGNVYRPPRHLIDDYRKFNEDFIPVINEYINGNSEFVIMGDTNVNLLNINEKEVISDFFDAVTSQSLYPTITFPTRFTRRNGSLIDNIFCKLSSNTLKSTSGIMVKKFSDHQPCFMCLDTKKGNDVQRNTYVVKRYTSGDYNNFVNELNHTDLMSLIDMGANTDPNVSYGMLRNEIQKCKNKHIPYKLVKYNKHKHKKSNWITQGIIRSINTRDKMYKELKTTSPDTAIYEARKINLDTYNNILKKNIRTAKKIYYDNCFKNYKHDIKKTWSKINDILCRNKNKKKFPEFFTIGGTRISDKNVIANKFNEFFVNIGPELARNVRVDNPQKSYKHYLRSKTGLLFRFREVNTELVSKIIGELKPKTSCGFDGFSMKLIKLIELQIVGPVTSIINQMLNTGIFPDDLKIAKVVPLFKKGDDTIFSNYRPISLLPAISKIFEKVIYKQVYDFFKLNKLLYPSQYGFRQGHSTELAAMELVDKIIQDMDKNEIPLNIYLDLSKAFDTLDHDILIDKLYSYGFRDNALGLFKSYLSNRKQFVEFNDAKSELLPLQTGVPQGSVLGPLLFIIYINDIANVSNFFKCIIYADDTTLYSTLSACNLRADNGYDNTFINNEIDKISEWLKINKLSINVSKSKCMFFHTTRRKSPEIELMLDNSVIERVNEFNFLGIVIDSNLSWKNHNDYICNKLSKTIGVINRLKNFLPLSVKVTLYNSLVLSHINYGLLLWGHSCNRIIKTQKRAIRTVTASKYNAHTEPLFKKLNLLKLSDVITLMELKFYHKFVNNRLPLYFTDIFSTNLTVSQHKTRNARKIFYRRVEHVYARQCVRHALPKTINCVDNCIREKVFTHSLHGLSTYIKKYFVNGYKFECNKDDCYICKKHGPPDVSYLVL